MEERVGRWWHLAISRLASTEHADARVHLKQMEKSIGILFRSAGGAPSLRLTSASAQRVRAPGHWLQRIAGSATHAATAQLEPEVLALPATLAVFASRQLNRDLYLWLAMLSAHFEDGCDWIGDNVRASTRALQTFTGFVPNYQRLLKAHLSQRPEPGRLKGPADQAEQAIRAALDNKPQQYAHWTQRDVAPVWLWLGATAGQRQGAQPSSPSAGKGAQPNSVTDPQRRRTRQAPEKQDRTALVLPSRTESVATWSDRVSVNRSTDDEDDHNALEAANDMEQLAMAPDGQTLATRVKFDLDLPSASADDRPLGPGIQLPEWDYRKNQLLARHCCLQVMQSRSNEVFKPTAALKLTARRVRRRLETLRDAPRPQHGQDSGDDLDLDGWVRYCTDQSGHSGLHSDSPPIYTRKVYSERSLSTLLLADLSLSTDAYATEQARVIDVIRDALFVFGEALSAVGDPFAVWGFSSVRRHQVRLQHLKRFDETWSDASRARVGAIKPGYYTRMGAAIRFAQQELSGQPQRRKLLMLLTDGKPNDLDIYEGRYGLEDTRHAVLEARAAGVTAFCITIDETAHDYLPMLFGQQGYALVRRPQDLVNRLTQAWTQLSKR
jgi:nitric oxide reductase NorD protein